MGVISVLGHPGYDFGAAPFMRDLHQSGCGRRPIQASTGPAAPPLHNQVLPSKSLMRNRLPQFHCLPPLCHKKVTFVHKSSWSSSEGR